MRQPTPGVYSEAQMTENPTALAASGDAVERVAKAVENAMRDGSRLTGETYYRFIAEVAIAALPPTEARPVEKVNR